MPLVVSLFSLNRSQPATHFAFCLTISLHHNAETAVPYCVECCISFSHGGYLTCELGVKGPVGCDIWLEPSE